VTQLKPGESQLPLAEQNHQPLGCFEWAVRGCFQALVDDRKRDVCHSRGYASAGISVAALHLYTDHRNLVYIFNMNATNGTMARYRADELQRCAMSLMSFKYMTQHVPGEVNVRGGLLIRWGAGQKLETNSEAVRVACLAVVQRVSPLEDPEFMWPSEADICAAQDTARAAGQNMADAQLEDERHLLVTRTGKVYIKDDAVDRQQRLCVVAHAGASGHRGARTTQQLLRPCFTGIAWRPTSPS
jgi:hypothetical protein